VTTAKYDELDRAILAFIGDTKAATGRNGVKAMAAEMVSHQPIQQETTRLSIATGPISIGDHKPPFRFLDSRLQALKRAGKIRYSGARDGWVLVERPKL
jgi:hypothetical protein